MVTELAQKSGNRGIFPRAPLWASTSVTRLRELADHVVEREGQVSWAGLKARINSAFPSEDGLLDVREMCFTEKLIKQSVSEISV